MLIEYIELFLNYLKYELKHIRQKTAKWNTQQNYLRSFWQTFKTIICFYEDTASTVTLPILQFLIFYLEMCILTVETFLLGYTYIIYAIK